MHVKGRLKVLVLTDEGKKAIRDMKIEKVFHKNASWEHEYWKYSGYIYNIKKDLDFGFEKITLLALNHKIKEKIISQLKEKGLHKEEKIIIKEKELNYNS